MNGIRSFLVLSCLALNVSFAQTKMIDHCSVDHESDFCSTDFRLYSDSTFIRTSGCEIHQSIQVGRITHLGDTNALKLSDLNYYGFIDTILFVEGGTNGADTLDVFYFDNEGNPCYLEEDFVTYTDSVQIWWEDLGKSFRYSHQYGLKSISRNFESYKKNAVFLSKDDPFYYSHSSYLTDSDRPLSFVLRELYLWTGEKKYIPIPPNTTSIHVFFKLPKEIISIVQFYGVQLDHSCNGKVRTCNSKVYIFEN